MTKNTRDEIDKILTKALNDFYDYIIEKDIVKVAHEYSEKTVYKTAKQAIEALIDKEVAKANTPTHIMGKPIDEVIMILSALELERIEDLKMTMSNLDEWMKRVRADHHKAMQKAVEKSFERFAQPKGDK